MLYKDLIITGMGHKSTYMIMTTSIAGEITFMSTITMEVLSIMNIMVTRVGLMVVVVDLMMVVDLMGEALMMEEGLIKLKLHVLDECKDCKNKKSSQ